MQKKPVDILWEGLQSHDIAADRVELQRILDGEHGPSVEAWINDYLGTETLLTKEELLLYSALQESGDADTLAEAQDLSLIRGFSDEEIQEAIDDLKKSTAAVEKQTNILRVQQDAMELLVNTGKQKRDARSAISSTQHKAWMSEYKTTSNAVEELLQNLRYQLLELETQRKATDTSLNKSAAEILKADDKLLLSLRKLASDLEPNRSTADEDSSQRIKDLCARLIKYTVEGIRSRLDRVYLEATNGSVMGPDGEYTEESDVVALREELESLYAEILPVAQMSTEQQYLEPALRAITARNSQGKYRSEKALEYVSDCFTFLISRLEDFATRAEEYQSHRFTTSLLISTTRRELDIAPPLSPNKAKSFESPTRRKNSKSQATPIRPRPTRRRSSATSFDDDTPAEQQLLRNLGISLPEDITSERTTAGIMAEALADRTARLAMHAKTVQEGTETSIADHLHDAHVTLELLRESLLSETKYGTVRLMDKEVEDVIAHLEAEVEDVNRKIGTVDLEKLKEKNVKRDELVERWAR